MPRHRQLLFVVAAAVVPVALSYQLPADIYNAAYGYGIGGIGLGTTVQQPSAAATLLGADAVAGADAGAGVLLPGALFNHVAAGGLGTTQLLDSAGFSVAAPVYSPAPQVATVHAPVHATKPIAATVPVYGDYGYDNYGDDYHSEPYYEEEHGYRRKRDYDHGHDD
eukprot:Selendium_serpulae@DN80_c0_g1_i1.p1